MSEFIIDLAKSLVNEASKNNKKHRIEAETTIEIALRRMTLADVAALVEHLSGGKWKAVPVEATKTMCRAYTHYMLGGTPERIAYDTYQVMIAAAPKPEDV